MIGVHIFHAWPQPQQIQFINRRQGHFGNLCPAGCLVDQFPPQHAVAQTHSNLLRHLPPQAPHLSRNCDGRHSTLFHFMVEIYNDYTRRFIWTLCAWSGKE